MNEGLAAPNALGMALFLELTARGTIHAVGLYMRRRSGAVYPNFGRCRFLVLHRKGGTSEGPSKPQVLEGWPVSGSASYPKARAPLCDNMASTM